jgi:hypothetical protein
MSESEDNLDQTRNPCSCLQMADVGFYRTYQQWIITIAAGTVDCTKSMYFNRVSQRSTRAVCFNVSYIQWTEPCVFERVSQKRLLGDAVWDS